MTIDNDLYKRPGDIWRDEREPLATLRTMINPGRFGYFRAVLTEELRLDPRGKLALDVGCGGGLLAEEFTRLACRVVGVDPAVPALATARAHAVQSGLAIAYCAGAGENLPLAASSFDIAYCCDVLEHVADVDLVLAEIARVLKPGGVFLFDTINRTWLSKLVAIKIGQEWRVTRCAPPNLHDWQRFITPRELQLTMARHQLVQQEVTGLRPVAAPWAMARCLYLLKRGAIPYGEFGRRLRFHRHANCSGAYMGYALRSGADTTMTLGLRR